VADISEVLERHLCFNGYCKAINIAATRRAQTNRIF